MAVPPKRTPGYLIVVTLVVVGLLVAVLVVYLRPQPVLGPSVVLIRADGTITATPANTSIPADFGPHCSQLRWNARTHALAVDTVVNLSNVEAVLVHQYRLGSANLQSDGGDHVRALFSVIGGVWRVASPVDDSTLAILTRSGANVTANGTAHAPGESWTMRFEYDAITVNGTVHVVEVVAFRNEGVVPTHLVPPLACA